MTPPPPILAQKRMRERLSACLKEGAFAALDLGSSKAACLIVEVDPARLEASGAGRAPGESDVFSAARVTGAGLSRALGVGRDGAIFDPEGAAEAAAAAISAAEAQAGRRVRHAVLAVGGSLRIVTGAAGARVRGRMADDADVARVLEACCPPADALGRSREPIDAFPADFSLDGKAVRDPRGRAGERLTARMRMVLADRGALGALAETARLCGLEAVGVAAMGAASGLACLSDDELDLGAVCLDMGGGATHIALFRGGRLVHADLEPLGGAHVTHDIAAALGVGFQEAERLKREEGGGASPLLRSTLESVIRPRLEETLEAIRARLTAAESAAPGFAGRPVILTGGASQIPGLIEIARRILGSRARLGRPIRVSGAVSSHPEYAVAAGLVAHALKMSQDVWIGPLFDSLAPATRLAALAQWWRRNW